MGAQPQLEQRSGTWCMCTCAGQASSPTPHPPARMQKATTQECWRRRQNMANTPLQCKVPTKPHLSHAEEEGEDVRVHDKGDVERGQQGAKVGCGGAEAGTCADSEASLKEAATD